MTGLGKVRSTRTLGRIRRAAASCGWRRGAGPRRRVTLGGVLPRMDSKKGSPAAAAPRVLRHDPPQKLREVGARREAHSHSGREDQLQTYSVCPAAVASSVMSTGTARARTSACAWVLTLSMIHVIAHRAARVAPPSPCVSGGLPGFPGRVVSRPSC